MCFGTNIPMFRWNLPTVLVFFYRERRVFRFFRNADEFMQKHKTSNFQRRRINTPISSAICKRNLHHSLLSIKSMRRKNQILGRKRMFLLNLKGNMWEDFIFHFVLLILQTLLFALRSLSQEMKLNELPREEAVSLSVLIIYILHLCQQICFTEPSALP